MRHKNLLQHEGRMLEAVRKTAWALQFHRPKMLRFLALGSSVLGKKCAFFGERDRQTNRISRARDHQGRTGL